VSFLRNLFNWRSAANGSSAAVLPRPAARNAASMPGTGRTEQPRTEDCISLPLKAITDLFPPELKGALHKQPSDHFQVAIPRELIRPQLAAGAVRITFAQLRAATPEIFFNAGSAPADAKVLLPLESVLMQMTPSRRADQRQPSLPVNIPSIFVKSGPPRVNAAAGRGGAEPWYSQRRPTYEGQPERPQPAVPPPAAGEKTPVQPPASAPEPPRQETAPPRMPPQPQAPEPAPAADTFSLPLEEVLGVLPAEVRQGIGGAEAKTASFLIPLREIEPRMRSGKLLFKWAQLRCWCDTELAAAATPDLEISLPLAAVVPLFMAARENQEPRKQVEIDTRIPDIFAKAKPAPAPAPVAPPAPVAAPAPVPSPAAPAAPAQLVERMRALEGVAGSFIATADGLLIAGDVPNANENVLAAFAPTVFAQLTKYADMARLGVPEAIDVTLAGGSTVHVRKAGKLYLGVLMPRGYALPIAELVRISKALQPHTT
jgi:predicted regulator of Ras-like GTPase activity (Roadblock/LC7/MglB family)